MRFARTFAHRVELPPHEGSCKWSGDKSVSGFDSTLVGLETDSGPVGCGEMYPIGPFYQPGYAEVMHAAMVKSGSRLRMIAHDEFTTDLPEWASMKPEEFWDARASGMGGSADDPLCSCDEENLLAYAGDHSAGERILIHELAHSIHLRGMVNVDPTFDQRVQAAYEGAMRSGLGKGKYASVNHHEYFAEGTAVPRCDQVARRLPKLQAADGSWVNPEPR